MAGFSHFYRFHVETGDYAPYPVAAAWMADRHSYPMETQFAISFYLGCIGPVPTWILMAQEFPEVTPKSCRQMATFFKENKPRLVFTADAKYRKMVFEQFIESVARSLRFYGSLSAYVGSAMEGSNQERNYRNLQALCYRDWFHWGHYGHWCFTEALKGILQVPIQPPTLELRLNKSNRKGWALALGRDDLAEDRVTARDIAWLERQAEDYIGQLGQTKASYFALETACCNYKRQWKASHYGGCYIDEMYDEIRQVERGWPERQDLWDQLWAVRQIVFPASLVYENYHPDAKAYQTVLHRSFIDHGRIPRVEAWMDGKPQVWPSAPQREDGYIEFDISTPAQ